MNIVRKHFQISGRVQGVGFRYRAKYLAQSYRVTGWVKNELNGDVTMELQGTAEEINLILKGINRDPWIRIDWIDTRIVPVLEEEKSFRVLY